MKKAKPQSRMTPEQVAARALRAAGGEVTMSKAERVVNAEFDFEFFCRYYLSDYFTAESAPFHRELVEMAMGHDRGVAAAPREHAKSTHVSFAFPLHQIVFAKRHFIVIFRESDQVATQNVDDIRLELETNERLREDFGELEDKRKWAEGQFVTKNQVKVIGRGRGSAARGLRYKQWRPDLVILDDIEDDELVESKERRDKLHRWFNRVVSNIVGPNGKLFLIGTILHHDSLLVRLLKLKDVFFTRIWQATTDGKVDGPPTWPARWSSERLKAKLREIGTRDFNTEFMNNPANEDEQIFAPNWWRYFKDEDVEGLLDESAAFDPAIGQKAKNDDSALAVVAERAGNYYLLRMRMKRMKVQEQVELVVSTFREFPRIRKFCIETIAYQAALKQLIDERSRKDNLQIPTCTPEDTKSEKLSRISTLAPIFEQGLFWIPSASSSYWSPDVRRMQDEFEALGCSSGMHDDGPDVVQRAIALFRGKSGRKGRVSW